MSRKGKDADGLAEAEAELKALGMPRAEIDAALRLEDEVDEDAACEVWHDNAQALNCFLLVASRRLWRLGPLGGIIGLDYAGVEKILSMRKIEITDDLLDDLAVMEDAAVEVLNATP